MRRMLVVLVVLAAVSTLNAQSLLYRSPNLGGTWVQEPGVVQFNFAHRFHVFPRPQYAVANFPTFTFATGLGHGLGLGLHYGTKSLVVASSGSSNEIEWFARWRAFGGPEGSEGFTIGLTPAYNGLAKSADGELDVDWTGGPLTLSGAARIISKPLGRSGTKTAFAGGFVARLTRYIAVSADLGAFVSPTTRAAWSAAVALVIPGSPHTFSLQASNATVNTMQGNSKGTSDMRYGFEFTIPLHLKRFSPWFHGGPTPAAVRGPAGPVAAEVRMAAFKFQQDTVVAAVGETVRWTNTDPVEHTVTFDSAEPGSPPIPQNGSFSHRFDRPGTYPYHCTPHPFMKAVVVVR